MYRSVMWCTRSSLPACLRSGRYVACHPESCWVSLALVSLRFNHVGFEGFGMCKIHTTVGPSLSRQTWITDTRVQNPKQYWTAFLLKSLATGVQLNSTACGGLLCDCTSCSWWFFDDMSLDEWCAGVPWSMPTYALVELQIRIAIPLDNIGGCARSLHTSSQVQC